MASSRSDTPPPERFPWYKLPTKLKGYILWLELVPDGVLFVKICSSAGNPRIVPPRPSHESLPRVLHPLHQDFSCEVQGLSEPKPCALNTHRYPFFSWAVEQFVGQTWISYGSVRKCLQAMALSYETPWMLDVTMLSLELRDVEDFCYMQRIGCGRHLLLPSQYLRLRISPGFFSGSHRDITVDLWAAEDFRTFFDPLKNLVAKVRAVNCILVGTMAGNHGTVFKANLHSLKLWLDLDPSMIPIHAIPPAEGACPWDTLPIELKVPIFELVYLPQREVEVFRREKWVTYSGAPRRAEPHIAKFLVSRQWLEVAWKHFISHAHLHCPARELGLLLPGAQSIKHWSWVHGVQKITISLHHQDLQWDLHCIEDFLALKVLLLQVAPKFFPSSMRKIVTTKLSVEADFRSFWNVWKVPPGCTVIARPIDNIGLKKRRCDRVTEIFTSNVKMFERLLHVHIRQGRVEDEDIPTTEEEVENLWAINRTGMLELLREVKRERMDRRRDEEV